MNAVSWRTRLRRLVMGIGTVTGLSPQGWFIPYRYRAVTPDAGALAPYAPLEALFRAQEPDFLTWLERIEGYWQSLAPLHDAKPPAPRFAQSWYPGLDGAFAYTLIRAAAPRRLVEVGSGHSTRFFARAAADAGAGVDIVAIDPAPRADIAGLPGVTVRHQVVQDADPALFAALLPGDVLAIDSSHILMPGSDVDLLFNRVLPTLKPGVLVQVHDVLLPDDYPADWAWRGYNEQNALAGLLRRGADLLWSSHYVRTRMGPRLAAGPLAGLHVPDGARETALWFKLK